MGLTTGSGQRKWLRSELFSVLAVCGLWVYYRADIFQKADDIFQSLFGKNLSGRNLAVQIGVLGIVFLICVLVPVLLERLISRSAKFSQAAYALPMLILCVPAVQTLIICANQVLRRDDYWEIADARLYGFPGSMFYEIRQWNGRYTGWGLRSLHAVLPDIPYIDIFLFVDLVLLTVGTTLLAQRMLKKYRAGGGFYAESLVVGFGLSLSFVLMSSNIWEFWFWGSGTMIYGFGISMCVLSLALILNVSDEPFGKPGKMILPAITCFLTSGCSELCAASLAAFLLTALIWKRIRTGHWNKRVLFFFVEIIILFAAIFLMSGSLNYAGNRAYVEGDTKEDALRNFFERLPGIINWAFEGLHAYTFIKPKELILFLGVGFLIGTRLKFDKGDYAKFLILALILTAVGHSVLLINTLLDYMPPRVITVGICWFVTAMAIVCMLAGSLVTRGNPCWNRQISLSFCALLLCLVMNRFYSENIDDARKIRESWNIRDTLLSQYTGWDELLETCSLPSPGSFREDILEDPEDEFNLAVARFYQVDAISATFRCPPYGETFLPADRY